ncbi:MAG: DUF4922 domain-containing protein [Bacteroidales bacterium]
MRSIQEQTDRLLAEQRQEWPQLREHWDQLDAARVREFSFPGFRMQVQFNPKRIRSSAAKVDKASIARRACFLCGENRPPEQRGVSFGDDFKILCNPFPIFRAHYTIVDRTHRPQVIDEEMDAFLDLSKALPSLAVFYNAPACGASAPDHLHFQAGNRGFMPVEADLEELRTRYGAVVPGPEGIRITAIDDGLRRFVVLESRDKSRIGEAFRPLSRHMRERSGGEEPMWNLLSYYEAGWRVLAFPRAKHRPWQYAEEGEKNILLSPASVDMGGMLITPLEKDFLKMTEADIRDIFDQVCLNKEEFGAFLRALQS